MLEDPRVQHDGVERVAQVVRYDADYFASRADGAPLQVVQSCVLDEECASTAHLFGEPYVSLLEAARHTAKAKGPKARIAGQHRNEQRAGGSGTAKRVEVFRAFGDVFVLRWLDGSDRWLSRRDDLPNGMGWPRHRGFGQHH